MGSPKEDGRQQNTMAWQLNPGPMQLGSLNGRWLVGPWGAYEQSGTNGSRAEWIGDRSFSFRSVHI